MFSLLDYAEDVHYATGGRKARSSALVEGVQSEPTIMELLAGTTTTASECAEDAGCPLGAPCASEKVLTIIEEFVKDVPPPLKHKNIPQKENSLLPTDNTPESKAVRAAAVALNCTSESCVVTHPQFRAFASQRGVTSRDIALEMELRFKAAGPRDSLALLSNTHIDSTLHRWARVFPEFYPCEFAMMDFDKHDDELRFIDMLDVLDGKSAVDLGPGIGVVRRKSTCFACVVNTDVSTGRGKHWVAVFVDCRGDSEKWTVEYFNSAGNPPPRVMTEWLVRTCARLATRHPTETVIVTDLDHQESQTECGLYALYYIRRRLDGTPIKFFFTKLVPDAAMTAFRTHVFRKS